MQVTVCSTCYRYGCTTNHQYQYIPYQYQAPDRNLVRGLEWKKWPNTFSDLIKFYLNPYQE